MFDDPIGESRLRVSVPAAGPPARAAEVLGSGRGAWVGELVGTDADSGTSRYLLDLELRVGDHVPRVTFHKAAFVELAQPRLDPAGEGVAVAISWRAAGMTPLFPVFAGELAWREGQLRLDGWYAPPGGRVGEVADSLLLNVAARATARQLLERIAALVREPG